MNKIEKVLKLLFDPEDTVCIGKGPYASHSVAQESILNGEVILVSPNGKIPDQKVKTKDLTHLCINPVKGFRNDQNATKLRSFLLEIDTNSIQIQYNYIKSLGIPYSAIIFSGGKSLHVLVALDEPLPDKKTYDNIAQWLLNIGTLFDTACKNPTRCVRFPGVIRPETGKEQKLLEIKDRIKTDDLMSWLNKHESSKPKIKEKKSLTKEGDFDKLSPWAKGQLKYGIDFSKGRNKAYFAIACDFARNGYGEEETTWYLEQYFNEESDFKEKEFLAAINSAFKYILG